MTEPVVLKEDVNANGNLQAFVEDDGSTVFLYLRGAPETGVDLHDCWIRNRVPAPPDLDVNRMKQGLPPILPRQFCGHPEGAPALDPEKLRFVWFDAGDGVALFEGSELLGVVDLQHHLGLARDCTSPNLVCEPLATASSADVLPDLERSKMYWASWEQEDTWPTFQERGIGAIRAALGKESNYYAIDNGEWPPKALLRIPFGADVVLITLGVAVRPQPRPCIPRRFELSMAMDGTTAIQSAKALAAYLSAQSKLPWHSYTWLGEGHTIPCDQLPEPFKAVVLTEKPRSAPRLALPEAWGEPVSVLWAIPITAAERAFAERRGSQALLERLWASGVTWSYRQRAEIPLAE
jgi:hypothetical protein